MQMACPARAPPAPRTALCVVCSFLSIDVCFARRSVLRILVSRARVLAWVDILRYTVLVQTTRLTYKATIVLRMRNYARIFTSLGSIGRNLPLNSCSAHWAHTV